MKNFKSEIEGHLRKLKNSDLDLKIKDLASRERELLHEVLLTVKEIDIRGLYLELGYANLFLYLTESVGYSAGSAQRRIDAARLLWDVPEVGEKIQSGELTLTQVTLLQKTVRRVLLNSKKVSTEDKKELLKELVNKNQRATEQAIASFFDLPVLQDSKVTAQSDKSVRLEVTISQGLYEKIQRGSGIVVPFPPFQ